VAKRPTKQPLSDGLTDLVRPRPAVQAPEGHAGEVLKADRLLLGKMQETNGASSLERVEGFDSYVARNRGLFANAPSSAPGAGRRDGFTPENVIGADDRVPVGDTTKLPWRCIAMLSITYANGHRAAGTAWFFGPSALGTAGHNVRHPDHGRAIEILVSPGYDGRTAPFNTFTATRTYCDPAWLNGSNDPELDYGVVLMDDPTVGERLGWFGFASYSDAQLVPLLVNVSGYAVDRSPRTQYFNGGRIEQADSKFLQYSFDTEGGMSGSPIFALFGDGKRVAVGIHTYGSDRFNRARRIDDDLYDVLAHFRG